MDQDETKWLLEQNILQLKETMTFLLLLHNDSITGEHNNKWRLRLY